MADILQWNDFKSFITSKVPTLPVQILIENETYVKMCATSDNNLRCDCIIKKYDTESMLEFNTNFRYKIITDVYASKGRLWELFGTQAFALAMWLNGTDPTQIAVKTMWDSMGEMINLDSPVIKQQLIPLLQSQGIIDATVMGNITAYKATFTAV